MTIREIEIKAEEIRKQFNPKNLSPFPFQNISGIKSDLDIFFTRAEEEENLSGVTIYNQESKQFTIIINVNKPKTRQNFTIAHELGHYFLHSEILMSEKIIIDSDNYVENRNMLYRLDDAERNKIETEANCFAAALLMPEDLVKNAWKRLGDIQECASVFDVSVSAMSIRLERLGLV